jgi:tripartite-type tricarboxylate transporter receptor subunit TctC
MKRKSLEAIAAIALLCGALIPVRSADAADQAVASFYHGKTITIVVGYGAGGGYDLYARLLARFIGDHVPGKPGVVVENMPGGGGRMAMSYAASNAPQDGTVLVTADQGLVLEQALNDPAIHFDLRKFKAIGNPIEDNNNLVTWYKSGIKTVDDAKKRLVTIGASPGASSDVPLAMNAIAHTNFKPILGYRGGNDIDLAMERGEVDGRGQNSFATWKASKPDWLRDKKINFIVQWGPRKAAGYENVPLLTDLAHSENDRRLLSIFSVPTILGRPFFATPATPADRVAALRTAFRETMSDPAFIAAAKKASFDLAPVSGQEMQEAVESALSAPAPVLDKLRSIAPPSK